MRGRAEDRAAVGPLALEHAARVMQPVGKHVQGRAGPWHQLAVVPDEAVAAVEGLFHDVFLREAKSFSPVHPQSDRVDPAASQSFAARSDPMPAKPGGFASGRNSRYG